MLRFVEHSTRNELAVAISSLQKFETNTSTLAAEIPPELQDFRPAGMKIEQRGGFKVGEAENLVRAGRV